MRSLKTQNLAAHRSKAQQTKDEEARAVDAKFWISQFVETKKLLSNFSFDNDEVKTLSIDIIENILDEKRRDRKIKMVLNDEDIEEYIAIDIHAAMKTPLEELEPRVREIVEKKQKFME